MTVYEFIENKLYKYKKLFSDYNPPKIAGLYSNSNDYERLRNKFMNYNENIIYSKSISKFIGYNLVGMIVSINLDFDVQPLMLTLENMIRSRIGNNERICVQNI